MNIIADSSASRTEWVIVEGDNIIEKAVTQGLNPFFQSRRDISHIVRLELPDVFFKRRWDHVFFYGAGCLTVDKRKTVESSLVAQFKTPVTVESDLLGAARGLLVDEAGVACILGTGSNTCYYDGHQIVEQVRSLGYVLGDEGSAAHMGKLFLSDCLKGITPQPLREQFYGHLDLSPDELTSSIYDNTLPSHTLAVYSNFLRDKLDNEYVRNLVYSSIDMFFVRNVLMLSHHDAEISLVGANACAYSNIIEEVAQKYGLTIRNIQLSSISGLVKYHAE